MFSRRDRANSCLPRSASIDSVVEAVWSNCTNSAALVDDSDQTRPSNSNTLNPKYLHVNYGATNTTPSRRESAGILSPSPGRKKSLRGLSSELNIYHNMCISIWLPVNCPEPVGIQIPLMSFTGWRIIYSNARAWRENLNPGPTRESISGRGKWNNTQQSPHT